MRPSAPVDAALRHAPVQHFEPLPALAAADDLADPGRQHVHRCDRPAVVVHPHVEGLDGLRVVHHDDRLLCVFFGQIALVLGLRVDAPFDRELELLVRPLEHLDRLAIIDMHEFRGEDAFQFRDERLLDALVKCRIVRELGPRPRPLRLALLDVFPILTCKGKD